MNFISVAESLKQENAFRESVIGRTLVYGINFFDQALTTIFPDDLVLLGASTGVGKTQLCTAIAMANIQNGKRVHYFALEARRKEIEFRIKFELLKREYFRDPNREFIARLTNAGYRLGFYEGAFQKYEALVSEQIRNKYSELFLFYKGDRFDADALIEHVARIQDETDLIIIDHVHYFDWDDFNDNRAIKEIAKTARLISLDYERPIILVGHLRKRDRFNLELCPGLEEFHGSSDLSKIATKVITISRGPPAENGNIYTYARIPKNRIDGDVTPYVARMEYNPKEGNYEKKFELTWANLTEFELLDDKHVPVWAQNCG